MNYQAFLGKLASNENLADWANQLPDQINAGLSPKRYGDLPRWQQALSALPELTSRTTDMNTSRVGARGDITPQQSEQLREALMGLHPWRKGPFELFGVHIDTEWQIGRAHV